MCHPHGERCCNRTRHDGVFIINAKSWRLRCCGENEAEEAGEVDGCDFAACWLVSTRWTRTAFNAGMTLNSARRNSLLRPALKRLTTRERDIITERHLNPQPRSEHHAIALPVRACALL